MRVVIGEDEALLREGLSLVLDQGGFDVVATEADAQRLVDTALEHQPDLVITDIRMPPTNTDDGLRAALQLRTIRPDAPVVILSQFVQRQYALELIGSGATAVGYLLKHRIAAIDRFLDDLRRVVDGATVLDPEVVATMVERARRTDEAIDSLTARQRDVLALIAQGRSNAAIADELQISERTVVQHSSQLYDRLGIIDSDRDHRRVLAVLHYFAANSSNHPGANPRNDTTGGYSS